MTPKKNVNEMQLPGLNFGDGPEIINQLFDRISLPTFVIDRGHVIRYWNSALEALTGLDRDSMIGTKDQWRPFYSSPRPCLADLIVEGGRDDEVQRYYTNKYTHSTLINDAFEAEDFFPECGENGEWLHFTAASLLNTHGEVIGAIETLAKISDRKQAEFELVEREQTYREQSITDSLTDLYNSRHFYAELNEMLENSKRYNHRFSLCFLDLDHFKKINDGYGHLVGDTVLETFGRLIRSSLRTMDRGFRYGGEEFAIILPSTEGDGAVKLAERVRESLENYSFPLESGERFSATVSIGVTEYMQGDSVKTIMQRADNAVYQAKEEGRNRVVRFPRNAS